MQLFALRWMRRNPDAASLECQKVKMDDGFLALEHT